MILDYQNGSQNGGKKMIKDVEGLLLEIKQEMSWATENYPPFNSAHEGFSILNEEVDELWEHVKVKQKNRDGEAMQKEAIQIAAMALRFAYEVCFIQNGKR